tara:strand:- start:3023 stop:3268 length:246 start_codon:yes stop_codon:yes gene_type:complete
MARIISSRLTAESDRLFPLWTSGLMTKDQLISYLNRLIVEKPVPYGDGLALLAHGLAARLIATRGIDARLSDTDVAGLKRA